MNEEVNRVIYQSVQELIGKTPLLLPQRYNLQYCQYGEVLCKLEAFNPAGSAKDRVARAMLDAAEREGFLRAGATVIEPTSGNTGIGLAMLCAARD